MEKVKLMKRFNLSLFFLAALLFWSCEGPVGPQGPPGSDGLDGVNIVGEVFEIVGDFVPGSDFRLRGEYGFDILESDKVLILSRLMVLPGYHIWRLNSTCSLYMRQMVFYL